MSEDRWFGGRTKRRPSGLIVASGVAGGGGASPPAFVGATTAGINHSVGASTTIAAPVGLAVGHFMLLSQATWNPNRGHAAPSGSWTELLTVLGSGGQYGVTQRVWYRLATVGDLGATYTVGITGGNESFTDILMAYSGAALHLSASLGSTAAGASHTGPTLTTTEDNCMLVHLFADEHNFSGNELTLGAGPTLRARRAQTYSAIIGGDEVQATAGLTVARTMNSTNNNPSRTGAVIALAAA